MPSKPNYARYPSVVLPLACNDPRCRSVVYDANINRVIYRVRQSDSDRDAKYLRKKVRAMTPRFRKAKKTRRR